MLIHTRAHTHTPEMDPGFQEGCSKSLKQEQPPRSYRVVNFLKYTKLSNVRYIVSNDMMDYFNKPENLKWQRPLNLPLHTRTSVTHCICSGHKHLSYFTSIITQVSIITHAVNLM